MNQTGEQPLVMHQPGVSVPDVAHLMRPGSLQFSALPPLSLYVHLPWCLRKCPYCDFNSHGLTDAGLTTAQEQAYLQALRDDLDASLPLIWGRTVHSIFVGGGTPSVFSPDAIAQLLSDIRARLRLSGDCEITLEANPGTFEADRFAAFAQAGVTRLSIGVQTFNDDLLQRIGRVHSGHQARLAAEEAARCFDTFNLDVMYALPGQTLAMLKTDLQTALSFEPPHVSVYHLTLEPNTVFATRPPSELPDDDTAYDMLDTITGLTARAGLQRYEVSAYAQPGHECWHNVNYWSYGDYLGIGAGAHSKLTFAHRVIRQVRLREPALYMRQAAAGRALASSDEVKREDLAFEFMMNALRLRQGFDRAWMTERTGLPASAFESALKQAESRGLIICDWQRVVPTERGFDFLSDLQAMFLPEQNS